MSQAIDSPEPRREHPYGPGLTGLLALLASPGPRPGTIMEALAALTPDRVGDLLAAISYHRIDGLAHRTLASLPGEVGVSWIRSTLRRRHQRIAAATLAQGLALGEMLEALHALRIPAAILRGLRSVEGIYGDPGVRPFEDHDLLVLPSDLPRARQACAHLGYAEIGPRLFRRGGTIVDLHDEPLGARRRPTRARLLSLTAEMVFSRSSRGAVAGAPALILESGDELLLLAIHVVKHSFDRLIRLADLAHLLASREARVDWGSLRARAEASRALPALALALEAASLLGSVIPEGLRRARPRGFIESVLMRRVLELRPVPYSGDLLLALTAPSLAEGAGFLIDALLPSGDAPRGALSKATLLPFRAAGLVRQAAAQAAVRRRAR
jgi:Uncharacterised nucleotidyltransferase